MLVKPYVAPLREAVVHHAVNGAFAIRQGSWKLALCADRKVRNGAPAIQLYNLQGQLVYSKNKESVTVGKWTNTLPIYQLAAGTYLMQVQADGQTWNKKIVITH
jgi:hypothetical protein